jgi:hypothetical protein
LPIAYTGNESEDGLHRYVHLALGIEVGEPTAYYKEQYGQIDERIRAKYKDYHEDNVGAKMY